MRKRCVVFLRVWHSVDHTHYHLSKQVPDYYDIITEPMDLSTVMKKIDEHQYITPSSWLADIDLITRNALE